MTIEELRRDSHGKRRRRRKKQSNDNSDDDNNDKVNGKNKSLIYI